MTFINSPDRLNTYKPRYFEFPENPKTITVEWHSAYQYIIPSDLDRSIASFSEQLNLNWFDTILINQKGGQFFANKLLQRQGRNFTGNILNIEYHEDRRIVTPVPDYLSGFKNCSYRRCIR